MYDHRSAKRLLQKRATIIILALLVVVTGCKRDVGTQAITSSQSSSFLTADPATTASGSELEPIAYLPFRDGKPYENVQVVHSLGFPEIVTAHWLNENEFLFLTPLASSLSSHSLKKYDLITKTYQTIDTIPYSNQFFSYGRSSYIIITHYEQEILVYQDDEKVQTLHFDTPHLTVSPDLSKVLYYDQPKKEYVIYDIATQSEQRLRGDWEFEIPFSFFGRYQDFYRGWWLPDGENIVFDNGWNGVPIGTEMVDMKTDDASTLLDLPYLPIKIYNMEERTYRDLISTVFSDIAVTPNGQELIVLQYSRIFTVDVTDGTVREMADPYFCQSFISDINGKYKIFNTFYAGAIDYESYTPTEDALRNIAHGVMHSKSENQIDYEVFYSFAVKEHIAFRGAKWFLAVSPSGRRLLAYCEPDIESHNEYVIFELEY